MSPARYEGRRTVVGWTGCQGMAHWGTSATDPLFIFAHLTGLGLGLGWDWDVLERCRGVSRVQSHRRSRWRARTHSAGSRRHGSREVSSLLDRGPFA